MSFKIEINLLSQGKSVRSGIASLNPFLDHLGVLRVGGRLDNAINLPYDKMHPIILPKSSFITTMLIRSEHLRLLHAGPKLVLSSLSQRFWIPSGAREVKKTLHSCIKCFRLKSDAAKQLMGSLPRERISANKPFQQLGIDFVDPLISRHPELGDQS